MGTFFLGTLADLLGVFSSSLSLSFFAVPLPFLPPLALAAFEALVVGFAGVFLLPFLDGEVSSFLGEVSSSLGEVSVVFLGVFLGEVFFGVASFSSFVGVGFAFLGDLPLVGEAFLFPKDFFSVVSSSSFLASSVSFAGVAFAFAAPFFRGDLVGLLAGLVLGVLFCGVFFSGLLEALFFSSILPCFFENSSLLWSRFFLFFAFSFPFLRRVPQINVLFECFGSSSRHRHVVNELFF